MKPNKSSPAPEPLSGNPAKPLSPLNLSPEQAKREARKLHQGREELEDEKTTEDTSIRTSPLGRTD